LKVGGRAVLLVGAAFRQLLIDCVGRLNDADVRLTTGDVSEDSAQPLCLQTDNVLGDTESDGASGNNTDVDSGHTTSDPVIVDNANVLCTKYEQFSGETASFTAAESCPVWTTFLEHYVKLCETHAYICDFTKIDE